MNSALVEFTRFDFKWNQRVTPKEPERIVLILDNDLGFAVWLGRALTGAGFHAFPAARTEEAAAIVRDLHLDRVDLVIANLSLAGSREFVEMLKSRGGSCKVIDIRPPGGAAPEPGVDAVTLWRPNSTNPSAEEYIRIIKRVLK